MLRGGLADERAAWALRKGTTGIIMMLLDASVCGHADDVEPALDCPITAEEKAKVETSPSELFLFSQALACSFNGNL